LYLKSYFSWSAGELGGGSDEGQILTSHA
jgi:hypothetical protein